MTDELDILFIQKLQFSNRVRADALITRWFHERVGLQVTGVELRPSEVSLNSFKGYATWQGKRVFFKSHTESHSKVMSFYDSNSMIEAGYDIARPIASHNALGTQVVLYDADDIAETMFDRVRRAETGTPGLIDGILEADRAEGPRLLEIYQNTAQRSSAEDHEQAAVHQLFHHRLVGKRFQEYYDGASFTLPDGRVVPIADVFAAKWRINGIEYDQTLGDAIEEAKSVLRPDQPSLTVIGHGDAHPGNKIITSDNTVRYFAPAFGGRHNPLLDATKPVYHAVLARWMYYGSEAAHEQQGLEWSFQDGRIDVHFMPAESAYRGKLHASMSDNYLRPLLAWMAAEGALPHGQRPLDLALMCCPLLTVNPANGGKYPSETGLMGFAQAVQMANGAALDVSRVAWWPTGVETPAAAPSALEIE